MIPATDAVAGAQVAAEAEDGSDGPVAGKRRRDYDTATYLVALIRQLAALARSAKLDLLADLLDMARMEAESQVRQLGRGLRSR